MFGPARKDVTMKPTLKLFMLALLATLVSTPASAQEGAPDLTVKQILFEQSPSSIRVRVLNQGTATSASCHLALQSLVGSDSSLGTQQRVWTISVPPLEAGKGFSQPIDVAPLTQANGPWRATIDRSNQVAESNETNNSLTYSTNKSNKSEPSSPNRRRADLIIESFALIDPENGDVKVNITNKGGGNSKACILRLIVWEPEQFEQKEARTVFVNVQPLHSLQKTTVMARAGVSIINTKYSMFIDIGEDVLETDENNNRAEGEAGNFKP
jgi:hypothetical protein